MAVAIDPGLLEVVEAARKHRLRMVAGAGVVTLFGVGLAAAQLGAEPRMRSTGVLVLGVAVALLGIGAAAVFLAQTPEKLLAVLTSTPGIVAWIYVAASVQTAGGVERGRSEYLNVCLTTGERFQLEVTPENRERLLQAVHSHAPNAVVGYGRDLEDAYRENPAHFVRRFRHRAG